MFETIAQEVRITDDCLSAGSGGWPDISVPLALDSRPLNGTPEERNNCGFIVQGEGIHWPDLHGDISVENLLLGKRSGEVQALSSDGWTHETSDATRRVAE